jgi:hypothetical protein
MISRRSGIRATAEAMAVAVASVAQEVKMISLGYRPQQGGHLLMRALQRRLRRQTKIMYRRRVAVKVGQKGHHRFQNHRVETGGGVIIEINLFHLVPLGSVNRGQAATTSI